MEITGRIIFAGKLQEGESNFGPWRRIGFVMEEVDVEHPERVSLRARGTKAEELAKVFEQEGTDGVWTAHFSHDAHAFEKDGEERWVNDLTCWKLVREG